MTIASVLQVLLLFESWSNLTEIVSNDHNAEKTLGITIIPAYYSSYQLVTKIRGVASRTQMDFKNKNLERVTAPPLPPGSFSCFSI